MKGKAMALRDMFKYFDNPQPPSESADAGNAPAEPVSVQDDAPRADAPAVAKEAEPVGIEAPAAVAADAPRNVATPAPVAQAVQDAFDDLDPIADPSAFAAMLDAPAAPAAKARTLKQQIAKDEREYKAAGDELQRELVAPHPDPAKIRHARQKRDAAAKRVAESKELLEAQERRKQADAKHAEATAYDEARMTAARCLARLPIGAAKVERMTVQTAEARGELQADIDLACAAVDLWANLMPGSKVEREQARQVLLHQIGAAAAQFWPQLGYKCRAFVGVKSGMYAKPEDANFEKAFAAIEFLGRRVGR